MGCVYLIRNTLNDKLYIGQTRRSLAERWREHWWGREKGTSALQRAIKKYGVSAFELSVLHRSDSPEDLSRAEAFCIFVFRSSLRGYGYNLTTATRGAPFFNEETRRRRSAALSGLNNPFFGKHHTPEKRAQWCEQRLGKTFIPPETYKAMAEARRGIPTGYKHPPETIALIKRNRAIGIVKRGSQPAAGHKCPNPLPKGHGDLGTPESHKKATEKCKATWAARRAPFTCSQCGKGLTSRQILNKRCCSRRCGNLRRSRLRPGGTCTECGKPLTRKQAWGGRSCCSYSCGRRRRERNRAAQSAAALQNPAA